MPYATNPADGVRINYEVEGQGPPLMLMHGINGSLQNWRILGHAQALRYGRLSRRGRRSSGVG